ncbi:MAG TPA: hypothetical protein VL860_01290 [Planctomycetota bacterium]|nr:hypothetical protein [Planctomycetota bacterium]
MSPRRYLLFATLAALLAAPAITSADAAPAPAPAPAVEKPAVPPAPAKPTAPPIPADGVLLRYRYKSDQTLKLTGAIKLTQSYSQSDQAKPVDRDAQIDVQGEMTFLNVTADGAQAVAESRIHSTTAGETTFSKSMQRIDDRGRVLKDQTDLPPPTPDKDGADVPPPPPAPPAGGAPAGLIPAAGASAGGSAPAPAGPPVAMGNPGGGPGGPGGSGGGGAAPAGGGGGGGRKRPRPNGPPPAEGAPNGAADPTAAGGAPAKPPIAAKADESAALQASRLVLPEGKVKAGDKWTAESQHVQAGAAGAPVMKDTLTVTVKELKAAGDHNVAILAFQLTSEPVETLGALKGATTVVQGESELNLEAGVIVKSTLTTDTTAEAVTDGVKSQLKIHAQADYTVKVEGGMTASAAGNGANGGWNGAGGPGGRGGPGGGGPGGGGGGGPGGGH